MLPAFMRFRRDAGALALRLGGVAPAHWRVGTAIAAEVLQECSVTFRRTPLLARLSDERGILAQIAR